MMKWNFEATLRVKLLAAALLLFVAGPLSAQTGKPAPFTDYSSYVAWMQKNHKAPFKGVPAPRAGARALQHAQSKTNSLEAANEAASRNFFQNVKVNQDR